MRTEHEKAVVIINILTAALVVLIVLGLWITFAHAHDIYTQLRSQAGQLCCGGDPVTGDCEPIKHPVQRSDGDAIFHSQRYNADVRVAYEKITWLPVPGGEDFEAHWCGVPRYKVYLAPINGMNPDLDYWTYCAFWMPGGM